jgi:hypothetical protein
MEDISLKILNNNLNMPNNIKDQQAKKQNNEKEQMIFLGNFLFEQTNSTSMLCKLTRKSNLLKKES